MWVSIRRVILATGVYAALHSLLASRGVKQSFRAQFGDEVFNGVYRFGFNAVALGSFALLLRAFSGLPDRTFYRVPPPWSYLLRLVQLAGVAIAVDANRRVGIGRMLGVQGASEMIEGEPPIPQNPAQGPQLEGDLAWRTGGAFRICRHPNNLAPLVIWLPNPKMTVRFLVFIAVSAVYLVLGSLHEEARLRAAYGKQYDLYHDGVPFFLPWPR